MPAGPPPTMQQEVSATLRISSVAGGAGAVGGKLIGLTSRALKLFGAVLRRPDNKRGESLTQRKGAAPEKNERRRRSIGCSHCENRGWYEHHLNFSGVYT